MRLSAKKKAGVYIDASVDFIETSFVVKNRNAFPWKNVSLEINPSNSGSGFIRKVPEMGGQRAFTIGIGEFVARDGTKYDSQPRSVVIRPKSLAISCQTPAGEGMWFGGFV